MTTNQKTWLWIYLPPYLLFGLLTFGSGLIMLPLGATLGAYLGLSGSGMFGKPITYGSAFLVSLCLFGVGYKFRKYIAGKICNAVGAYLWCFVGMLGFPPA